MIRIFGCITQQHDIRLVLLAAIVCALSCFTALSLLARAQRDGALAARLCWQSAAAAVAGAGVWSTHFVAMLAYHTWFIVGYDVQLTLLSIVIAMIASWGAFFVAIRFHAWLLGGVIFGLGVGAMHYTGMVAMSAPAHFIWDSGYVVASLAIGAVLGALGLWLFARAPALSWHIAGTLGLTLAIAGLHFTAMSALTLDPDPLLSRGASVLLAPDWFAVAIAIVMVAVVALGLTGSVFDHRLAERAMQEAARLRSYVAELETTRTELQETTEELRDSKRQVELALAAAAAGSQSKSQFLATMSHELRTPLNAIIGFSEVMSTEMYGPLGDVRYKSYIKDVHDSGTHLLQLVNDILDFSKADYGHLDLEDDVVDISALIASVARMVEGQFDRSGVTLSTKIEPDLPTLCADERRMRQILLNLLSNAAKFTPAGGDVRVTAYTDVTGVALVVEDTGIGMAPEDIPRALERFGQVDSGFGRKHDGAGLGLPLAKKLVELHGGSFELESTLNVGTRITLTFPRERAIAERVVA